MSTFPLGEVHTSAVEGPAIAVDAGAVFAPSSVAFAPDPEPELAANLPPDHPRWQCDTISLSARMRALSARILAPAVRVLSFWDHRLREIGWGSVRVGIDCAGSYRVR